MKINLLPLIGSFLFMVAPVQNVFADIITTPLDEKKDKVPDEEPPIGQRMPACPIQCIIDTDTKEVTLTPYVDDILSYEIWDETKTMLLFSTDEPAEFVDHLLTSPSPVTIVITTNNKTYVGLF